MYLVMWAQGQKSTPNGSVPAQVAGSEYFVPNPAESVQVHTRGGVFDPDAVATALLPGRTAMDFTVEPGGDVAGKEYCVPNPVLSDHDQA